MSRLTIYQDSRLNVIQGVDHMLGNFYQIFDKEFELESSEGEGLVLDWSELFGFQTNITGYPESIGAVEMIRQYVSDYAVGDNPDYIMTINLN